MYSLCLYIVVMIDYLIKHFLFTCLVNKSQPVPLLEKGGEGPCYIPCIEFYQYCVGLKFTNNVLVSYLIVDLIHLQIS